MRTSSTSIQNLAAQGIEIFNTNRIMGGKRGFSETDLTTSLTNKATYKAFRQIADGSFDGNFNMRHDGLTYNVSITSNMMHITGGRGMDICIEW